MTPHQLRLTAFGPFAGTVSVDLDALAASGLFLLHGATGAGKTTLLDGLGFALFGRVPGVRNAAKRLRSDLAAVGVPTEVQLEATLGGRRMRITRTPSWERPKARGTGTTTQQASVHLEELVAGAWVSLSTRVGEADQEIADLVGMSAEQFFQVVLLPQGDFAQFLRSSSTDRADVLARLFSTERFADVEQWLASRRRVCSERVGVARDGVAAVVARIAEAGAAEVPTDHEVVWAVELLEGAQSSVAERTSSVAALVAARDARRAAAVAAGQLAGLQQRRSSALTRQRELEVSYPTRLLLQQELDAAGRAAEVAPVLAAVTSRRAARDLALEAEGTARAVLADGAASVVDLRASVAAARERTGHVEALRVVETARAVALDEAAQARAEQADALASVAAAELELAALPARRAQANERLTQVRGAASAVPGLEASRATLRELRPDVVSVVDLRARLGQRREEHLSAREAALGLEIKANDLRVASINSMIAVLAFRLEDGVPCDVCGSSAHPDPSQLRDEGVSTDDEERARRAADESQEVVASLQALVAADEARVLDLGARVGDWTLPALDEALAAVDLELDVVAALAGQAPVVEQEVADLERLREALASTQVVGSTRADAADRRAADALGRAQTALAELESGLGTAPSVDAVLRELSVVVDRGTRAVAAVEAVEQAQRELDGALALAVSASAAAGFASVEDAVAAQRTTDWRSETTRSLREAADVGAAVTAELADPALDVPLEPAAPVDSCSAALAVADAELAAGQAELGSAQQRAVALQRLVPALERALAELAPLEAAAAQARGLADLCAGQGANGLKMTLTSFVLAARLQEVAEAASVRLLRMTQGRYSLVHTDGAARGGQRSGLGLLARDGWTGQDRDTSTLSGGETFLASLSLALGLADVVTAEAGGSRIGALFVDEGFGTLDEDSLDEVMDVLDGLREGGRVVGLVSHVAELRNRIPARVQVLKTRAGSDLVLHGC